MADSKKEPFWATRKSKSNLKMPDSGLSASLLAGSEEIFDFFCQPCNTENMHLEAVGYCQQCEEYLCATCYRCHRKITITKHHHLLEKSEMIKTKVAPKPPDYLMDKCHIHQDMLLEYFREIHVKTNNDLTKCNISGIAAVPGDRIVLTDYGNKTLKLVDTSINKVTSCLSLSSKPHDVTATKANQVAVSLGSERKIEMFTVTDKLSRSNTVTVNVKIFSRLCFDGKNFIIVSGTEGAVKIVDMSGRVLSTVSTDKNGDPLFSRPFCIALGRGKDVVHITDPEANTVMTMTLTGQVISVYRNDELKYPFGVAVGPDGGVYVCSSETHTVHLLSDTGELLQILLGKERGLSTFPRAIAHDQKNDRLYISSVSDDPDYVKLLQLE